MRCGGRVCWANAELCAQSDGCSRKAVQGSRGCGACWAGERLRRAVRGLVGRELRCDVRCGLSRASAGCRGGGLRASMYMGLRNYEQSPINTNTTLQGAADRRSGIRLSGSGRRPRKRTCSQAHDDATPAKRQRTSANSRDFLDAGDTGQAPRILLFEALPT